MQDTWEIQKTDETRLFQNTVYHQRNKDETIISVIKLSYGEQITSRLVRTQNREFSVSHTNIHRLSNLIIIIDGF